jgi:hypothetical protein
MDLGRSLDLLAEVLISHTSNTLSSLYSFRKAHGRPGDPAECIIKVPRYDGIDLSLDLQ